MYTFNTKEADGQSLVHLINLMLGDNITGAEVGAATALTSCTLLQNCPSLKLYVIDAWRPFMDYIKDPYDKHTPCLVFDEKRIEYHKMIALHNIKYSGCIDRAIVMQMDSNEACQHFENDSLDFVFLDAHLTVEQLDNDLDIWYKKVRKGGLFAVHDTDVSVVTNSIDIFRSLNKITNKLSVFDRTHVWCK